MSYRYQQSYARPRRAHTIPRNSSNRVAQNRSLSSENGLSVQEQLEQESSSTFYVHQISAEPCYNPLNPLLEPSWDKVFNCFTRSGPMAKGYCPVNYRYEFRANLNYSNQYSQPKTYQLDGLVCDRVSLPYTFFHILSVSQRLHEMAKVRRIAGLFEYIDHLRRYRSNNIRKIHLTINRKYYQIKLNSAVAQANIDSASGLCENLCTLIDNTIERIESLETLPTFGPLKSRAEVVDDVGDNCQIVLRDPNNNLSKPSFSNNGQFTPLSRINLTPFSTLSSNYILGYGPSSSFHSFQTSMSSGSNDDSSSSSSSIYFTPLAKKSRLFLEETENAMSSVADRSIQELNHPIDSPANITMSSIADAETGNCKKIPFNLLIRRILSTNPNLLPNIPAVMELSKSFEPNSETNIVSDRNLVTRNSEYTEQSDNVVRSNVQQQKIEVNKVQIKSHPLPSSSDPSDESSDYIETYSSTTVSDERIEYKLKDGESSDDVPAIVKELIAGSKSSLSSTLTPSTNGSVVIKEKKSEHHENQQQITTVITGEDNLQRYTFDRRSTSKDVEINIETNCANIGDKSDNVKRTVKRSEEKTESRSWDERFTLDSSGVRYWYKLNDHSLIETTRVVEQIAHDSRVYLVRNQCWENVNNRRGQTFKSKKPNRTGYFVPSLALTC